jgi:hypothetical protein
MASRSAERFRGGVRPGWATVVRDEFMANQTTTGKCGFAPGFKRREI